MEQSQPDASSANQNRTTILHAATIVGFAFVLSRLLGLFRDAVVNYYYGITSPEANAYVIANRFPETIFLIIAGGALGSAFIPVFSAYFVRGEDKKAWQLFSAIINLVTILTTVVAGIAAIFSPQIINLFYPDLIGTEPAVLELSVDLMRVMLISPIIFGISGIVMSALNARQHFLLPAIAPIIYNLGIIAGAIILAPNVMGLALGTVAGSLGHLLIQIPGLKIKHGHYSPVFSLRDPGVVQVLKLMAPRVLGLSFGQLNHLLIQFLAQSMLVGSIPALGYAWRIMIMPQGIIGQALAIAAFPTFSTLAAKSAFDEMRHILADTLRLIFFLSLPVALLLMILRVPLITVLFQRGQFDASATETVAWGLLFYGLSLVGLAAIEILSRAFYALEDTLTPVLIGFLQLMSMWILGRILGNSLFPALGLLGLGGLAFAYTLSTIVELILLVFLLARKMGGIEGERILGGLWRFIASSLVMAAACALTLQSVRDIPALLQLVVVGIVAAISYSLTSFALGVTELNQLVGTIRRRVGI